MKGLSDKINFKIFNKEEGQSTLTQGTSLHLGRIKKEEETAEHVKASGKSCLFLQAI